MSAQWYKNLPRWVLLLLLLAGLACQLTNREPGTQEAVVVTAVNTALTDPIPTVTPLPQTPLPTLDPVTAVPTATDIPPTVTAVPTVTNTPIPWMERMTIGTSWQERPIEAVRFGSGERWFVVMAAIHGGHECNTNELAEGFVSRFTAEPSMLPESTTLFVVPLVNPDGCALNSRYNASDVDLNRNWETDDWIPDAAGPLEPRPGAGGAFPFSERETAVMRDWLLNLKAQSPDGELRVVSYHSIVSTGLAQPAYAIYGQPEARSEALARRYAEVTGYLYSAVWVGTYTITGEFIHWAGENGFIAFDVELPDGNTADSVPVGWSETHLETNLQALLTVMNS